VAKQRFNHSHKREMTMRKFVVGSIVLGFVTCGWSSMGVGEQRSAPRGELRIVDKSPVNWQSIVLNVFEHLVEFSKEGTLVPGLATGWQWLDDRTLEVTLRQGVTFHNGEVFDTEIVKLNWEESLRLKQPFRPGTHMNFKPGLRLEIRDAQTVRFHFPEPDGAALPRLASLHMGNRQFYTELGWGEEHW
jgi:ABC-type transport system substrate-binding protein